MIYDLDNNRLTAGQAGIDHDGQKTIVCKIDCQTGYYLRSSAVADIAVEAKRSADSVWTNIETTPIDLTPWNGTMQNFDIRITAESVSGIRRRASITVGK